jgi:hypothetical protein
MNSREEEFYEIAGSELVEGNYKVGLWNKAFSMALGDSAKSRALYMKFRVEEMEAEAISSAQRLSANLDNQLSSGFMTPENSALQWHALSEKAHQKYSASEYSKNDTYAETELTNDKGFKYYAGIILSKLGYIIIIITVLIYSGIAVKFIYQEFGIILAIIAFLFAPLTALLFPIIFSLYTGDWESTGKFYLWLFTVFIVIGIGNMLSMPFKVKEKSTNPAPPKNEIEGNGICDRDKRENAAILNLINPLKNITVQDTDVFSIINFNGSPSYLQYPIEVSRASSVTNMLEFRIIDLIKLGYLKGVNHNGEWYIDIFQIYYQNSAGHRTFHNLTNSSRSKNVIDENGGIESDTSTPPPLPSESSVEPPTLPEDSSPSEIKVYKIEESKFDSIIFIIATIIFSCVVLLIAIGFIGFAIGYLRPSSNYTSNTTPYANTTPPSAVTPQQVDSTSRAVLPEISESFILRTDTYLEIRKEPTMESKIIAKIPESSYIISIKKDYTGQNGSEWSLITLGPYEGWVPKRFLSKITKYQK